MQLLIPFARGENPQLALWCTHTVTPTTLAEVLRSPKMPKNLAHQSRTSLVMKMLMCALTATTPQTVGTLQSISANSEEPVRKWVSTLVKTCSVSYLEPPCAQMSHSESNSPSVQAIHKLNSIMRAAKQTITCGAGFQKRSGSLPVTSSFGIIRMLATHRRCNVMHWNGLKHYVA